MTRPGFLHTSPVHVPTFDALLSDALPGVQALHIVDESLLADARAHGPTAVAGRVAVRLTALRARGADVVCCTCSTIGDIAEQVDIGIPVMRVDRPMAIRAVDAGPRIGLVAALTSTVGPTRALLTAVSAAENRDVAISPVTVEGAWHLFERGDQCAYLARIADAARELSGSVDVIVLAQASMEGARSLLADVTIPVLSSPRSAIEHLAQ